MAMELFFRDDIRNILAGLEAAAAGRPDYAAWHEALNAMRQSFAIAPVPSAGQPAGQGIEEQIEEHLVRRGFSGGRR